MNAIFYRYVKTFIIRWSVWWSVRNFYRYDDRWFDRYETFIGMMFWSYKNFYRYDWSVRWWSSWSVRNFYRYGTFIGMKLLWAAPRGASCIGKGVRRAVPDRQARVLKLLSVQNFYRYETLSVRNIYRWNFYRYKTIKLFFISVHMAFKLLSIQWLMNEWMNEWMNE